MNRKQIEEIDALDRETIEQNLINEKALPLTDERIFSIGYMLLKLERLDEAYSYLEKVLGDNLDKINILYSWGYYEDPNGNCRTIYLPDNGGESPQNDNDCCSTVCGCACCMGCCKLTQNDTVATLCQESSQRGSDLCLGTIESMCTGCC